jgi:Rieske Fe-S protein
MLLLRLKNYEFDFIVIKKSDLQYSTFELRCTHEAQPLTASNKHIFCASHGSVFDFEGNALKQPATRPLTSYKTDILNHQLIIYLN